MDREKQERNCSPAGANSGEAVLEVVDGEDSVVSDDEEVADGVQTMTGNSKV
jgi:hypothetical protein